MKYRVNGFQTLFVYKSFIIDLYQSPKYVPEVPLSCKYVNPHSNDLLISFSNHKLFLEK